MPVQALLVWERFGYPDFLTAEADELIGGQYSDRSQLRPVLEAVLVALPALGPVTVQARKTCVSMVTPRRIFAVVQATTKSRADLGLRLEHERPGGRLLAALAGGPESAAEAARRGLGAVSPGSPAAPSWSRPIPKRRPAGGPTTL